MEAAGTIGTTALRAVREMLVGVMEGEGKRQAQPSLQKSGTGPDPPRRRSLRKGRGRARKDAACQDTTYQEDRTGKDRACKDRGCVRQDKSRQDRAGQ